MLKQNLFYKLMEDNVFLKKKNNGKYNPDISKKYSNKKNSRDKKKFTLTNQVYKPITDGVNNDVKSVQDLKLQKDTPDNDLLNKMNQLRKSRDLLTVPKEKKPVSRRSRTSSKLLLLSHRGLKRNFKKKTTKKTKKSDEILASLKNMGIIE